jgi:hypothetical protein
MFKNFLAAMAALTSASAFATAASAPAVAASGPVLATAAEVGFFAGLAAFITGAVAAWGIVILGVLVMLGILFEHNGARGWSVFSALVVAAVAYLFFNVSLLAIAIGAVGYIVIGLIWSFWRYKRHAQKVVEANKKSSAQEKEYALRALHPKAMLGTITAWIIIWPFSMVENVVGDVINFIQELVTKFFRGVYHKIYDSAVAALK